MERSLEYASAETLPASRWGTAAVWAGGTAVALFALTVVLIRFVVVPAHAAVTTNSQRYDLVKALCAIVPAWTSFGLALVAAACGIVGLTRRRTRKDRALVGIVLAACVPLMVIVGGWLGLV